MSPRLRLKSLQQIAELQLARQSYICLRCQHMATAVTPTPAPSTAQMSSSPQTISHHSPVQPPSHRDPTYRKSQLIRSYVSLMQTTPLMLLFQHNNLKSMEWVGIRRELSAAMGKVDEEMRRNGKEEQAIGKIVKLTIIQTNIFEPALRIAEYYRPGSPASQLLEGHGGIESGATDTQPTHALSESAYRATRPGLTPQHPLATLLTGPIAILTFPSVTPAHVAAALRILSPDKKTFRAPKKATTPGLYEPSVQEGLQKLMLLGARVDERVFDSEGVKWIGGVEGGIDGLRAQLVAILQGFGASLTTTLTSASSSIWATVEARRNDLAEPGVEDGKGAEQERKA